MNEQLNEEFDQWVGRMGLDWAVPAIDVPKYLGQGEVRNRLQFYPAFGTAVTRRPVDLSELAEAGRNCVALSEQFDIMQFNAFVSRIEAIDVVSQLVTAFPKDDNQAALRIDEFIEKSSSLGYANSTTGKSNLSSAALLASSILTAALPRRFVDFRQNRWRRFADELEYPLFVDERPTYGQMIVQTGRFAAAICETESFKRFWPNGEPLWTLAGICRSANADGGAERPKDVPFFFYEEDFEEGASVLRAHFIRERNSSVVRQAKELWIASDPLLRCDVCGFSFVETFGVEYIEAHHTKPLGELRAATKTRVSDLAKVCGNCHRILHHDSKCLQLDEVKKMLRR